MFVADPRVLLFDLNDIEAAVQLLNQAADSNAARNTGQKPPTVAGRLIPKIPWLNEPIGSDIGKLLPSSDALAAANLGLRIIDTLAFKQAQSRSDLMPLQTSAPSDKQAATQAPSGTEHEALRPRKVTTVGDEERKSLSVDFQRIAAFRAFHVITLLSAGRILRDFGDAPGQPVDEGALRTHVQLFNIARFLSTYFDAYFRGGQFIASTFDPNGEAALASEAISRRIGAKLDNALPPAQVKQIVSSEIGALCGKNAGGLCASLALGKTSFVTRAGLSVQFAGLGVSIVSGQSLAPQATYPKASEFGPQMIRVLIEAIFDANGPHPTSVHQSTACVSGLFEGSECLDANAQPDALMTRIDMLASSGEALSSAGVGAIIRGANVSALNNEAVANMLETFAGVSSRKVLERVLQAQAKSCSSLAPVALEVKQGDDGL